MDAFVLSPDSVIPYLVGRGILLAGDARHRRGAHRRRLRDGAGRTRADARPRRETGAATAQGRGRLDGEAGTDRRRGEGIAPLRPADAGTGAGRDRQRPVGPRRRDGAPAGRRAQLAERGRRRAGARRRRPVGRGDARSLACTYGRRSCGGGGIRRLRVVRAAAPEPVPRDRDRAPSGGGGRRCGASGAVARTSLPRRRRLRHEEHARGPQPELGGRLRGRPLRTTRSSTWASSSPSPCSRPSSGRRSGRR